MATFEEQVRQFVIKTTDNLGIVSRKIALDSFTSVITISPVDTGLFRGNWQPGIGAPPGGVLETLDPTGAISIGAVEARVAEFKPGEVIYLANNLPYAERLEDGYSKIQAPNGMVRLTQQRFQAIASAAIAQVGDP